MARKGILVSSPDVKAMTPLHWQFEYHALRKKEEEEFKVYANTFRKILVGVLGLDLLRPNDEQGIPKKWEDMTDDERDAFTPMSLWVARPDMLKTFADQVQDDIAMEGLDNPDTEYEKIVQAIDEADGDMEPIIGTPIEVPKRVDKLLDQPATQPLDIDVTGKV
jgi:hypothetical protein